MVARVHHKRAAAVRGRRLRVCPKRVSEKGSGTVVRSTLRAVPATVLDPDRFGADLTFLQQPVAGPTASHLLAQPLTMQRMFAAPSR
jgi:hypothetical protein